MTSKSCGCHGDCGLPRRDFVKLATVGAAGALSGGLPAMAGPFNSADFARLVPPDKRLSAEWVKSLFARGEPAVYRGADLDKIGMPVGGICTGQLYLGGDGRLWHWDIFNQHLRTGAEHYARPLDAKSIVEQGFAVRITAGGKSQVRRLDASGFADVGFCGQYPIGRVEYRDAASPVAVTLEAFSPFIPLNVDDSSLPATIFCFTLKNTGAVAADCELGGWLENAVCRHTAIAGDGVRTTRVRRTERMTLLEHTAAASPQKPLPVRPDIVLDDFEKPAYDGWTATGEAFGAGPVEKGKIPKYQGDVGGEGRRVVNSHAAATGANVGQRDDAKGRLTSREFVIARRYIRFYIGGGNHAAQTCLNLLVGGKVVRSATGHNDNRMTKESFNVRDLEGQTACLEIVDQRSGSWGNIGVDQIVMSDRPGQAEPLEKRSDFGELVLVALDPKAQAFVSLPADNLAEALLPAVEANAEEAQKPFGEKLVGGLRSKVAIAPGESASVTFLVAWRFPNHKLDPVKTSQGRRYAARFPSALAVADYVVENLERLVGQTRLWRDTWYDSSLPHWFLDRTFLNTSILASSTCHWFADGRFYGWEGVGCCAGTCTHVWHYAHSAARLFPQLERDLRERTDFGLAFNAETGVVKFRGEGAGLAIDGQAGVILRSLREHQMSADEQFLRRTWPKIRQAVECLIVQDGNGDGILEGAQHNTLDADWFGPVAWLSGLYLAALRAGEELAREAGDPAFAQRCRKIFDVGVRNLAERLWGGEYFVNQPDPKHAQTINSGTGCEIDQVFGQSWAWQVGLGRVLPADKTRQALQALWRYNFSPDVGPYREANKSGRWYAMPGEAGLLMCTFPRNDWNFEKACGVGNAKPGFAGYFNECMNGFEHQVAGHMLWEGMLEEGLAVIRAVHDRYHPARRNPWNEVECGDHYARSMASYGVFLAACGFEYHGPRGRLGFAPRLGPDDFRAAFTAAEGWGTIAQRRSGATQRQSIVVRWGKLKLRSLIFAVAAKPTQVTVTAGARPLPASFTFRDGRVEITLAAEIVLDAGQELDVTLTA